MLSFCVSYFSLAFECFLLVYPCIARVSLLSSRDASAIEAGNNGGRLEYWAKKGGNSLGPGSHGYSRVLLFDYHTAASRVSFVAVLACERWDWFAFQSEAREEGFCLMLRSVPAVSSFCIFSGPKKCSHSLVEQLHDEHRILASHCSIPFTCPCTKRCR